MAAKKFSHHIAPHHHEETDEHHRAHALGHGALLTYAFVFALTIFSVYFIRIGAPQILGEVTFTAEQIIQLTNVKRVENGLNPVTYNPFLALGAAAKAQDMFANNYWAHFSPQGKSPWNFMTSAGYRYIYAGENLARDFKDPASLVNAWMASESHRSNLLDKNFKEIGVAVADGNLTGREGILVVQFFGSAVSQVPASEVVAQAPTEVQIEPETASVVSDAEEIAVPIVAQAESVNQQFGESATVLASNQYSYSKIISLALVGFVFMLFVVEVAVAGKKSHLKIKSSTYAHLGVLAVVLFALWYAVQGALI